MFNAFAAWPRMMSAAFDMTRTGMRASETMTASHDVVARRSEIIGAAMRSPLDADHAELAMMVPEKMEAFSQAGMAMFGIWQTMHASYMAEMAHLGAMAMRGRPPTLAEINRAQSRSANYAMRSVERSAAMGAAALAPIHKAATANARRLKRP